jgi:hypothetical protein
MLQNFGFWILSSLLRSFLRTNGVSAMWTIFTTSLWMALLDDQTLSRRWSASNSSSFPFQKWSNTLISFWAHLLTWIFLTSILWKIACSWGFYTNHQLLWINSVTRDYCLFDTPMSRECSRKRNSDGPGKLWKLFGWRWRQTCRRSDRWFKLAFKPNAEFLMFIWFPQNENSSNSLHSSISWTWRMGIMWSKELDSDGMEGR